eukprot:5472893-Prymnesium_polylepis.1
MQCVDLGGRRIIKKAAPAPATDAAAVAPPAPAVDEAAKKAAEVRPKGRESGREECKEGR